MDRSVHPPVLWLCCFSHGVTKARRLAQLVCGSCWEVGRLALRTAVDRLELTLIHASLSAMQDAGG